MATSASRRGAPPIASSASGRAVPVRRTMATRSPPRPHFDGSSTVSASAAQTAASNALPPARIAAAPAWAASGAAAHTTPFAPRPVHCSATTLNSLEDITTVERARSACARRTKPLSANSRRSTTVARPGRGNTVPSAVLPFESHGTTATAWQPSGEAMTTSSSTRNENPSICGQTLRHCCDSRSSRPWTISAYVPKATTSGENRRRAAAISTAATSAPQARTHSRTEVSIDSDSEGSCILERKVYSIRKGGRGTCRRRTAKRKVDHR